MVMYPTFLGDEGQDRECPFNVCEFTFIDVFQYQRVQRIELRERLPRGVRPRISSLCRRGSVWVIQYSVSRWRGTQCALRNDRCEDDELLLGRSSFAFERVDAIGRT